MAMILSPLEAHGASLILCFMGSKIFFFFLTSWEGVWSADG